MNKRGLTLIIFGIIWLVLSMSFILMSCNSPRGGCRLDMHLLGFLGGFSLLPAVIFIIGMFFMNLSQKNKLEKVSKWINFIAFLIAFVILLFGIVQDINCVINNDVKCGLASMIMFILAGIVGGALLLIGLILFGISKIKSSKKKI